MSFTFDLSTNVGKVRNLIGDTNASDYQLTDEEITSILSLASSDIFLASAICLKRIAADKALVQKRVKAGNYEEDPKEAINGMLKVAENYEKMAKDTPADAQTEIFYTDFNYNEILNQRALRGEDE